MPKGQSKESLYSTSSKTAQNEGGIKKKISATQKRKSRGILTTIPIQIDGNPPAKGRQNMYNYGGSISEVVNTISATTNAPGIDEFRILCIFQSS